MSQDFSQNQFASQRQSVEGNINVGGTHNVVSFSQVIQISVAEIKTRLLIQTSPYKGLKKFELQDKERFFGREQFLNGLIDELKQTNFILLLGASGSGKSSVVRAGLLPWFDQEYGSRFVSLIFTPDQDPFESLYASLRNRFRESEAQVAREGEVNTLTQVVTTLRQSEDHWCIFIDQFEELFTTSHGDRKDAFIASLVQLNSALKLLGQPQHCPVKIVATMRADFLDRFSPYPALVKATNQHRPLMAEMQRDELRLAIEQPAAHHGVVFETGLVEEIIRDVQGQAGYLPLLQYTLDLLWETERQSGGLQDRTLNTKTYRSLGGVRGALQQHVDRIYDSLSASEKLAAQRIFLKLVEIGGDEDSGMEWKPVRRRATRSEFGDELEQRVLTRLIDANLLVSDRALDSQESTIEIAHEILLTSWGRLNSWIEENRRAIALRNRLNDDVTIWQQKNRDEKELWPQGSRLAGVLELRNNSTFTQSLGGFSTAANQFIDASVSLRDRKRRRTIIGLTTFSTVALLLAGLAGWQWQRAEQQRLAAEADSLGVTALRQFESGAGELESLLLAVKSGRSLRTLVGNNEAVQNYPVTTPLLALQKVLSTIHERNRFDSGQDRIDEASFSPDGELLATVGRDGTLQIMTSSGQQIAKWKGSEDIIHGFSFSPDGRRIATIEGDGLVRIRDLSGQQIAEFNGQRVDFISKGNIRGTRSYDFSSNQSRNSAIVLSHNVQEIAVATVEVVEAGNIVKLWDWSGNFISSLDSDQGIKSVVFSPDGKYIAIVQNDNMVRLWSQQGRRLNRLKDPVLDVKAPELRNYNFVRHNVSFSQNGQHIATLNTNGSVQLWNLQGKQTASIEGAYTGVLFTSDGQHVVTEGNVPYLQLWNLSGQPLNQFDLQPPMEWRFMVSLSPDGSQIATAGNLGIVRIWDWSGRELNRIEAFNPAFRTQSVYVTYGAAFSSDWQHLATTESNGEVQMWDFSGQRSFQSFQWSTGFNPAAEDEKLLLSPDRQHLAVVKDRSVQVWNVLGQQVASWSNSQGDVKTVFFSSDTKYIATVVDGSSVKILNLSRQQISELPTRPQGSDNSITFSPNGKFVAIITEDNILQIWTSSGRKIAQQPMDEASTDGVSTYGLNFSLDGERLALAGQNGVVQLFDLSKSQIDLSSNQATPLKGHQGYVKNVIFSPDSKHLATVGVDNTVRLWNLSGNQLALFTDPKGVTSAAFSPDGQRLAIAQGGTVQVRTLSGAVISEFDSGLDSIQSVTFSSDGKTVAAIGGNGTVKVWLVEGLDQLLKRSCDWLESYLTNPQNDLSERDRHICDQYAGSDNTQSDLLPNVTSPPSQVEQPIASPTPVESLPAPATPQPSPSIEPTSSPEPERSPSPTITYEFPPFPQPSCGDPPTPGATWYPVFINEGNEEEIRRKYCGDADSRIRESTGRPAVLVASFTDRQEAEAFAREVGGEVGEP